MTAVRNKWTDRALDKLATEVIMDPFTNQVLNYEDLGIQYSVTGQAIKMQVIKLRKLGKLPKYDVSKQFEDHLRPYTDYELDRIASLFNHGYSCKSIAERFNRTEHTINCLRWRLIHEGKVSKKFNSWTDGQVKTLLTNIRFDRNNIVLNYRELVGLTNHPYSSVVDKVRRLRAEGALKTAVRRGASDPILEKRKKYFDHVNEIIFHSSERKSN